MLKHAVTASFLGLGCVAMALAWPTVWVTPALLLCSLGMLAASGDRRDALFWCLGFVFGGLIDLAQTGVGVTVYRSAPFGLVPLYVFLYWGMVGVALRHLVCLFPRASFHRADALVFVTGIVLSLLSNHFPTAVALVLAVLAVAYLACRRRATNLWMALAVALFGPVTESMLISHGLYHFPSAHGGVVPPWLVALYACLGASAPGVFAGLEQLVTLPTASRS